MDSVAVTLLALILGYSLGRRRGRREASVSLPLVEVLPDVRYAERVEREGPRFIISIDQVG